MRRRAPVTRPGTLPRRAPVRRPRSIAPTRNAIGLGTLVVYDSRREIGEPSPWRSVLPVAPETCFRNDEKAEQAAAAPNCQSATVQGSA
jgi:hypothetical protein